MSQESQFSEDEHINWIRWFCALDDHQFFCAVTQDYIRQPFNLYGLRKRVNKYDKALHMILRDKSPGEQEIEDQQFLELYRDATELYGLIHARFITTAQGLALMREKYLAGQFGNCPRVLCEKQNVIPMGLNEESKVARVKVYCPRCQDIYVPKSKFADVDGSFFGSSFPHLLLMSYGDLKPLFKKEYYTPTIYGFKMLADKNTCENHEEEVTVISNVLDQSRITSQTRRNKKKKKR